jgi:hypothetical protein
MTRALIITLLLLPLAARAQSVPFDGTNTAIPSQPTPSGIKWTPAQWRQAFQAKQDSLGFTPLPSVNGTATSLSITSGTITNTPISGAAGAFTTLSATGTVTGSGFTALFAAPPCVGCTTPGAGAFTTLSTAATGALKTNSSNFYVDNYDVAIDLSQSFPTWLRGAFGNSTLARPAAFAVTFSPSVDTTNIWDGFPACDEYLNGPGHANGEINCFHAYFQVNAGATTNSHEGYESSNLFNGTLTGVDAGYLDVMHIGSTGITSGGTHFALKSQLQNDSTTALNQFALIDLEAESGTQSGVVPTYYYFARNAEPNASFASLGPVALGTLTPPGAGTLLSITGADTSGSTFPVSIKNSAGTTLLLLGDAGTAYIAGTLKSIGTGDLALTLSAQNGGLVALRNDDGLLAAFSDSTPGTAVANYLTVTSATAGNAPTISVGGTDTNRGLTIIPIGTGVVTIGAATFDAAGNLTIPSPATGTAASYACFTSAGKLISSATAC